MKTQILQLEPHDDIISVRDKLTWRQASRALLIWPARGQLLTRRLDLVLLLRHSQALGMQLALVTGDPDVRYHAQELGIPVFNSAQQAQRNRWKRPLSAGPLRSHSQRDPAPLEAAQKRHELLREPARQPVSAALSPARRAGFFTLGVLAILSIGAAIFPSARIELAPQVRAQELSLDVRAAPGVERASLSGLLPLRKVSAVVEGRDSLPTSGRMTLPDGVARGEATFTNLTDQPVSIPAGLIVASPGAEARFATLHAGQVGAGSGETINLPVQALLPGGGSNLPAGSLAAIQGQLGTRLSVTNPSPITGGSQSLAPAATAQDRSRLYDRLNATLQKNAGEEMRASILPGDILLDDRIEVAKTLENSLEPAEGEPASQLDLLVRLEFQAPMVAAEDLAALAQAVLDANLPLGFAPLPDTLEIDQLGEPGLDANGEATWRVRFRRDIVAQLPVEQARNLSLGASPAQAQARLAAVFPLASPPVIRVNPAWWPRMPLIPFQIKVDSAR